MLRQGLGTSFTDSNTVDKVDRTLLWPRSEYRSQSSSAAVRVPPSPLLCTQLASSVPQAGSIRDAGPSTSANAGKSKLKKKFRAIDASDRVDRHMGHLRQLDGYAMAWRTGLRSHCAARLEGPFSSFEELGSTHFGRR